jgi:predicted 3-demethylubiquinone-9 3-methyltransferase (glyoxalase superfamily)
MLSKNTICLWFDGSALEAAQFYAQTFPDSAVGTIQRAPVTIPLGKQGDVLVRRVHRDGHALSWPERGAGVQAQ